MTEYSREFETWLASGGHLQLDVKDPQPRVLDTLLRTGAVLVAAVGIVFGGVGEVVAGDPGYIPKLFMEAGKECEPVAQGRIDHDNELMSAANPEVVNLVQNRDKNEDARLQYRQLAHTQAEKFGLTLVDDTPYQAELDHAKSVGEVTEIASEFGRKYGFEFELFTDRSQELLHPMSESATFMEGWSKLSQEVAGADVRTSHYVQADPLNVDDIDVDEFKQGVSAFMATLHVIPLEVMQAADVQKVRIVGNIRLDNIVYAGLSYDSTNTILYELQNFNTGDSELITHEISHRLDDEQCGLLGGERDVQYDALNPPDFHYAGKDKEALGMTTEAHGTQNIAEDKATEQQHMLDGIEPGYYWNSSKVIADKYRLLLARLGQTVPGADDYLIAISPHYGTTAP